MGRVESDELLPNLKIFSFQNLYPIKIERAKKQYLWDSSGKKYIDFNTGNGIGFLGHGNPYVIRRIIETLKSAYIMPPSFKTSIKEEAIEMLGKIAPNYLNKVAILNTGTEAVELALKLLFKYKGKDKKIVYFTNSFHGRTLGALSITSSNPDYNKNFPLLSNTIILPYNEVEALEKIPFSEVAGIIVEVIQGEGGVIPAKEDFIRTLWEKCQSNDTPLVVDEIQSGFGRTGKLWAHMHYGIKPDILLAGKSIGGGVPVSIVFSREDIANKLESYEHGSTFGFNPLAAAGITGSIEAYFKFNVEYQVNTKSVFLMQKLKELVSSNDKLQVRGKGFFIGISQDYPLNLVFSCMLKKGIVISKAGKNTIRLLPPFLITMKNIEYLIHSIHECWEEIHGEGQTQENIVRVTTNPLSLGYGAKSS